MQFDDISYLENGTARQRQAYQALQRSGIFKKLEAFDPVLVGTIPINIDIETSDLDIICYFRNKDSYIQTITGLFGSQKNFDIRERIRSEDAVVAHFIIEDFEVEIFAQNMPSHQQPGFRHMLIEYRLLMTYGEAFRQQIIDLKRQGYKTEPAFAKALNLEGDPYLELLKLEL